MAARRTFAFIVAVFAALFVNGCSPTESTDEGGGPPPVPFPSGDGIQQNLSLASLRAAGWTVCLDETYADSGSPIADTLAACTGQHLMLACTNGAANDVLALAASDLRTVVTQADAATANAHHVAGTVGWFFTDGTSWGFFPAGEVVNREPCDSTQTVGDQRLCWHTSAGDLATGYRCGANVNLGSSSSWRRLILAHP